MHVHEGKCIGIMHSYARTHRVESGVGAWYGLFTGVGGLVVSLKNGTKSKVGTHEGVKPCKLQVCVLDGARKGL